MAAIDGGTVNMSADALVSAAAKVAYKAATSLVADAAMSSYARILYRISAAPSSDASTTSTVKLTLRCRTDLVGDAAVTASGLFLFHIALTSDGSLNSTCKVAYVGSTVSMQSDGLVSATSHVSWNATCAVVSDALMNCIGHTTYDAHSTMSADASLSATALPPGGAACDVLGSAALGANMKVAYSPTFNFLGEAIVLAVGQVRQPPSEISISVPTTLPSRFPGLRIGREPPLRTPQFSISSSTARLPPAIVDVDTQAVPGRKRLG